MVPERPCEAIDFAFKILLRSSRLCGWERPPGTIPKRVLDSATTESIGDSNVAPPGNGRMG